jgi:arylsulfatase A-like enzyme
MAVAEVLLILVAVFAAGCRGTGGSPDIILITVDTLRADHLGAYGYLQPVSPAIDGFAGGATIFANAVAPAPHTVPSLLEIMTSKFRQGLEIATQDVTLAELLRNRGYETAAVVDNALLEMDATARGLMRGFDAFYRNGQLDPDPVQQHAKTKTPADCITAQGIRWLKRRDRSRPFFLWLHYFDPHDPYLPPFADDLETLSRHSGSDFTGDIRNTFLFKDPNSDAARHLPDKDRQHLIDLYDAEIRYLDQSLGELFAFLKAARLYDGSLIALTADHGESFGEHGIWMHGYSLYAAEVHIPLIVKFPGQTHGDRVMGPVQAIDLVPTVADAAQVSTMGLGLEGMNLRQARSEPVFAFWGPWQLVETEEWKLLRHGKQFQLFRLTGDPAELHDVATDEPAVTTKLAAAATAKIAALGTSPRKIESVSSETVERMRALGYLQK